MGNRRNEYAHLLTNYLCKNPRIKHNGFHAVSAELLNKALRNLVTFERPDMYAMVDDTMVLIEHFEFDASKRTAKGMMGKKEESNLKKQIAVLPENKQLFCHKVGYKQTLQDWISNFEVIFDEHYRKIPAYKEKIVQLQTKDIKKILVGFFIENQNSIPVFWDDKHRELRYFETIQFAEKIKESRELDFVLFGYLCGTNPQIIYIDRDSFEETEKFIDLKDPTLKISPVCKNEIIVSSKWRMN